MVYETTDFRLAAFLIVSGFALADEGVYKNDRGETVFPINDPNRDAQRVASTFGSSICHRYDAQCKVLHALTQSGPRRRR